MKLYIANGTYVGTQAEAKAITKNFELVEVPVDKAGLIDYLNGLTALSYSVPEVNSLVPAGLTAEQANGEPIDLDSAFEAAPLSMQLRLAVVAIDAATANLFAQARAAKEPYHPPVAETAAEAPADASDLL